MTFQDQEDRDYELNARYDYIREAYGDLGDDPASLAAEDRAEQEEWDAFVGPRKPVVVTSDDEIPF